MKSKKWFGKLLLSGAVTVSCVFSNGIIINAAGNRVNFALDKPATGSYQDSASHGPEKAFDGDLSTRWGTDPYGSNQWVRVDLEKNYDFDEFLVAAENSDAQKIRQFKIEGSNNDTDYNLIYQSEDNPNGFDLNYRVKLDNSVNYRYVRITVQSLISGAYPSVSLREFEVIGNEEERISNVKEALDKVSVADKIYRDFTIPLEDKGLGVELAWTSSSDALVIDGDRVKINVGNEIEYATLTVVGSKDGYSQEKTFDVQVVPLKSGDYNIYPVPHTMNYSDGSLQIMENINIVKSGNVDDYVINYLTNALNGYQLNVSVSDEKDDEATNIYLGIDGQDDLINSYFDGVDLSEISDVEEAYAIKVSGDDNVAAILGNDYSGLFNGVFTLKQMMDSSNATLKDVTIVDAPDTKFRGIVEGFYGQYSHKERMDLLKFMGPLKMNTYIYGAKFDEYHRSKWREPYPEAQINELAELVNQGKNYNVEVVWAAHVGGNINMSSEDDFNALINKFDQLYSIGVRQFALFYDDAATDNTHLVEFINRVNREYIHQREGVKDLIMCPEQYCKTRVSGDYLDRLAGFDEDVQIMWTGDSVISEISPEMMEYIENRIKRPAYIWWNYPVNDLGMGDQLLVGETVGLSTEMNKMNGLVSNPMLQAQASKFSLFSIADYGWNISGFDRHKSWDNAVDYIIPEKEYADAFKIFAANNNQSVAELKDNAVESEYLMDEIKSLEEDLYLGFDISESGNALLNEFVKIQEACELLKGYTKNTDLISQISPWLDNLIEVSKAGQIVLNNLLYINENGLDSSEAIDTVLKNYQACQDQLNKLSSKYSGRRELLPFIKETQKLISDELARKVGAVDKVTTITNYRDGSYLRMDLADMIDGDINSAVTLSSNEKSGDWYGIDLGKVTEINTLEILVGKNAEDTNVAKEYKVQISNDGYTWQDIEIENHNNKITNVNKESARFVRYYVEEGCGASTQVREFTVNRSDKVVYTNASEYSKLSVNEDENVYSLGAIDNFSLDSGEYIGIKFKTAKEYSNILVNDELKGLTLEYSTDGVNWTNYEGGNYVARYVRLINESDTTFTGKFDYLKVVGPEMYTPERISVTPSSGLVTWSGSANDIADGNRDTYHWTRDQKDGNYYLLDLQEEMPIRDVNVVMISGDVMISGIVEISSDGETWEKIGDIGNSSENLIQVEGKTGRYVKVTVTSNSSTWLKINEVEINKVSNEVEIPVIENKDAVNVYDQNIDTKYVASQAGEIVYNNINTPYATNIHILKDDHSTVKVEGLFNDEWKELVTSNEAFINADFKELGEASKFRVSWDGSDEVTIYEIGTTKAESEIQEIDKTALKIAIDLANAITDKDLANVVKAVADEFIAARDEANTIYNDASATQEQVNNAFDRLASVMHMLDFVKGDKTALKAFIDKVSGLEADKYTTDTWAAFDKELDEANAVYADDNAMQEEVNTAYNELVTAFLNLRLIPDKSLLEELINQASGLDSANYTKASFDGLTKALNEAKAVFENPNATQKEVDSAKATLEKAIAGLQTVTTDNTVKTLVNSDDTTSVKTGDDALVGTLAGLALLSIAGAKVLRKKED